MTRLLRFLSPRAQTWVLDHGWLVGVGLVAIIALIGTVHFTRPDPFTVTGFEVAGVTSAFDTSTDSGFSYRFVMTLPDGTLTQVATTSMATAALVTDTACLERRAHDSGKVRHRITLPENCADPD